MAPARASDSLWTARPALEAPAPRSRRVAERAIRCTGGRCFGLSWLVAEPQAKPPGSQAVAPKPVLSAMPCLRNCVSARRARGWPLAGPDDPIRRRRPEALPLAIEVAPWLTRAPVHGLRQVVSRGRASARRGGRARDPPPRSGSRGVEEEAERLPIEAGEGLDLDHVDAPIAALGLRDVRLVSAQAASRVHLGQSSVLPGRAEAP